MKKIVTAIGNEMLNKKLKEKNEIEIIGNDIQYKEGIFEILEKQKDIDFLILSENICEGEKIENIVQKIKINNSKIKIIIILENKKEEVENILIAKGVYKIIYHNQLEIKDLISLINENNETNENEELKKEIDYLKELMIEKNKVQEEQNLNLSIKKKIKNKIKNLNILLKKQKLNSKQEETENKPQIISVSGPSGVGKSIIAINLAKLMAAKNKKVLLIDFDILNHSLHTILGVTKIPQKLTKKENDEQNLNIYDFIININKKIKLLSATDILFGTKEKIDYIKIENTIEELKKEYKTIIIDTSSECFFDFTKTILQISDKTIFITEANILEIKKAKELLNIYTKEWKINKNKINIVFNKYDKDCINMNLLKEIFCEFNILGVLKYHSKYNMFINKNIKNSFFDKKIREEYLNINKKIGGNL